MQRLSRILTLFLILSLPVFVGCEGPEGPVGPEGPEGPVGPAGEDGSMMYSGSGEPDPSIGKVGDYYLDTDTGEMYGPKDDSGWGNPIIVLKGENGQDGEDGSQIYSGNGTPDASLGDLGDFYLDQANYDMYGPKTDNGWGTPINLKGADGNANVTRYIYPGHDFSSNTRAQLIVDNLSDQQEMYQSAWLLYLVDTQTYNDVLYFSIPGEAVITTYSVDHFYDTSNSFGVFEIFADQQSRQFDRLEIVRIEASNTEDQTKRGGESLIIPEELNVSDYGAVAEYYGFYR